MKEDKKHTLKTILIGLAGMVIGIGICVLAAFILVKTYEEESVGDAYKVTNVKESNIKLPKFDILLDGSYKGSISNEYIEEDKIKVYEFDANIDNGWDIVTTHYVGVKLYDLLDYYQINNVSTLTFESNDAMSVIHAHSDLKNAYIVFYKDGTLIGNDSHQTLLVPDMEYRYSLQGLKRIHLVTSSNGLDE